MSVGVCLLVDTIGVEAGTERQVVETARRLDRSKFEVHVCCLEASRQLEELASCCRTAVFPFTRLGSAEGLRQIARLRRYLDRNGIRIVHAFMNKTAMAAVASSLGSGRTVITSRLNTGYWYTPFWKTAFRVLNAGATSVMANSGEARRIAIEAEKIDPSKVAVVYQGVDTSRFAPGTGNAASCAAALGIPEGAQVAGIVANLRPVKDVALFLRAARIAAERFDGAAFLVAGSGEQRQELTELANELGIGQRTFFTGGTLPVPDCLARMSIGCLTSRSEGFSNAILEYMAAGLPVVATDVGGNREAIEEGETGFLVRERSPEAFAAPLMRLFGDPELRERMGRKGAERCARLFDWSRTICDLERYYESLITRS